MEDYMDHKEECLWVCQNTHLVMNRTEKAIMKFQRAQLMLPRTTFGHLVLSTRLHTRGGIFTELEHMQLSYLLDKFEATYNNLYKFVYFT